MGRAITLKEMKEGEILLKWLESKLIRNNKNVLGADLGATGSGKSYRQLRVLELWYDYHFKEKVPVEHICFGVLAVMKHISSGKLRRGDLLMMEEAGVNLGSLDFQNEISKMMNYTLQSFRSMNIGILFNLPYLSMMNKSARMLLHYSFESMGIDFKTQTNRCKPFFHQVNQGTGKIYKKYPIVSVNGSTRKIKRFTFGMPSQYLIDAYEQKKQEYLATLTKGYSDRLELIELKKKSKEIKYPSEIEFECYHLARKVGMKHKDIAEKIGKTDRTVRLYIEKVENYLKTSQIMAISLGKSQREGKKLPLEAE